MNKYEKTISRKSAVLLDKFYGEGLDISATYSLDRLYHASASHTVCQQMADRGIHMLAGRGTGKRIYYQGLELDREWIIYATDKQFDYVARVFSHPVPCWGSKYFGEIVYYGMAVNCITQKFGGGEPDEW